jgi:hypothetical protein
MHMHTHSHSHTHAHTLTYIHNDSTHGFANATSQRHTGVVPARVTTSAPQPIHTFLGMCRYEREIWQLRQELAMHDTLCGRTGVRYGPMDDSDRARIADILYGYMRGDVDDVEVSVEKGGGGRGGCACTWGWA